MTCSSGYGKEWISSEPSIIRASGTAIWGPDAHFTGNDGSSSSIPTAIFVTVFAFLGTWIVARHGFREQRKS